MNREQFEEAVYEILCSDNDGKETLITGLFAAEFLDFAMHITPMGSADVRALLMKNGIIDAAEVEKNAYSRTAKEVRNFTFKTASDYTVEINGSDFIDKSHFLADMTQYFLERFNVSSMGVQDWAELRFTQRRADRQKKD